MTRTRYDAPYIVGFQDGEHRVLRDGCVVVEDDRVVHVGRDYDGPVDEHVRTNRLITPGLISTHGHIHSSPVDKSVQEDIGRRQFWLTGLIEILPIEGQGLDDEGKRACVDYSMAELIRTGTTTFMELGEIGEYVADAAEQAGLRAYIADSYRSGRWYTPDGKRVDYEWDEAAGMRGFDRGVELVKRLEGRAGGRIQGFLSPSQVDTCTEELLRTSRAASDELQVPLALHASQGVWEFNEMTRRHGRTPIEWLEDIGFLSEWSILGHVIFTTGNSWVNFAGNDLEILARSRASVSYNAWCFARRGFIMESFADYVDAGINMCLGTDTAPQSMIESLRWTAIAGKIASRQTEVSTARDVFDAATINAARMLHREDLGRIAPGAKADLLFWRTDSMFMTPMRDPIRNLVYYAQSEDLADVMVDGAWVMQDGNVLHVDEQDAAARVQAAGERMWPRVPEADWAGRTLDEISPPTYPDFA
jgi:5-methylthioadenosine/S-adenosylhomocysteine deaminase